MPFDDERSRVANEPPAGPESRAAVIAIASGAWWAKAENDNSMGSGEAGEESCGCREARHSKAGRHAPSRRLRELALNSILLRTKAPAAPTTKDFTTCSFLETS